MSRKQACNTVKAPLLREDVRSEDSHRCKMTDTTPPDRLSADPASKFFDAVKLDRGVHVFLDGKEYFNVEEYCQSEGWVRLPAGKARTRTGRPVTSNRKGVVMVRYQDDATPQP